MSENGSGTAIEKRSLSFRLLEKFSPFKKSNESNDHVGEADQSSTPWTFQGDALRVWVLPIKELPLKFTEKFQLPSDIVVGKVDFSRTYPTKASPAQLITYHRDTLDTGIKDLQDFFTSLDEGKLMPDYLIGKTGSIRMARAAKRFGFKTLEEGHFVRVIGKTETVREKFENILAKAASRGRTRINT